MPRILPYCPRWSASTLLLREKVCKSGSHMLDCPLQSHTSPNVTSVRVAVAAAGASARLSRSCGSARRAACAAVRSDATTVTLPPAGAGRSSAFHRPPGETAAATS